MSSKSFGLTVQQVILSNATGNVKAIYWSIVGVLLTLWVWMWVWVWEVWCGVVSVGVGAGNEWTAITPPPPAHVYISLSFFLLQIPTTSLVHICIPYVFGRLVPWVYGNNGNVGSPIPSYLFMFMYMCFLPGKWPGCIDPDGPAAVHCKTVGWCYVSLKASYLTHCVLVTPYGDNSLRKHWLG